jgi:hypothetical protein
MYISRHRLHTKHNFSICNITNELQLPAYRSLRCRRHSTSVVRPPNPYFIPTTKILKFYVTLKYDTMSQHNYNFKST